MKPTEENNNELDVLTERVITKVQNEAKLSHTVPENSISKGTFRQITMVILANIGIVAAGMGLGFPAISLKQLTDPQDFNLTSSQASWFASINAISCPLGGLLSGYLLDKIGRKRTILCFNGVAILSWILLGFPLSSEINVVYFQMIFSRFLIGVSTGLASSPAGVYSAEICHSSLRGRLTLGTSIAMAIGIMLIYILGFIIRDDLQTISLIACGYSVISFLVCLPIKESPSWLLSKRREYEALSNLRYFRGMSHSDTNEYNEIRGEWDQLQSFVSTAQGTRKPTLKETIQKPEVFKPLLIMIGFFGFQQFSGTFVIIVYAVQFSIEAGVTMDPILCAILIGLTRLVATFLVGGILDRWGRRPPAMISASGMTISMFLLAASSWFSKIAENVPYLAVGSIIFYIFTSTLGLMTLPFSMISEVFPTKARGQCAGITICCGYFMSFIAIKLYPGMVAAIGNANVFALYGAISLLAAGYIFMYLPETKGKTLVEIEEYFKGERSPIRRNDEQECLSKV